MKIVKADSKGRVTGFEPGVEYKVGEQSGDTLIRRTDKKTRTELTAWAVQEVFSGQLKEDKGWAEHVEWAIRHGVYADEKEIWLVANGWKFAKKDH